MNRTPGVVLLLSGASLVAAGACGPRGEDAPWERATASVLFGATRDGRVDLWVAGPGGAERPAVVGDLSEIGPRIAPDGVRLLFHAPTPEGPYHLFVATPDAVEPLVAEDGVYALNGIWSPDGRRVAYFSNRRLGPPSAEGFFGHVWIRDLETGLDRQLTGEPLAGTVGPSDWSPDGRWILAARPVDGRLDVVRIDVETGAEERLTRDLDSSQYGAAFSHDGTRIAFHAESDAVSRVMVLDLADGARRVLTSGPGRDYSPVWSPDDAWLLVNRMAPGADQLDLVALRVADGEARAVVVTPADERYGVWVPPGSPWRSP